jgi:hypothetical protein
MMADRTFYPPRQRGQTIHAVLIPIPLIVSGLALVQTTRTPVGLTFYLLLAVCAGAGALVPWLGYRLYCLQRSAYTLDREGIRIQWGLRIEDIPMPAVLWVQPVQDLADPPPLPWLPLPGGLLGVRHSAELGRVEYLASEAARLVLIGTPSMVYAISPEDPVEFMHTLQQLIELGSLAPLAARSVRPASVLARVWADRWARSLLLAGLVLGLAVAAWVALLIPSQAGIPVGFTAAGTPRAAGSAVRLTLFPVINTSFLLGDWALGIFLYRQDDNRPLAYVLWIAGSLTSLLFLAALALIVNV